jgi:uncharacterized protein (DUF2384 family)
MKLATRRSKLNEVAISPKQSVRVHRLTRVSAKNVDCPLFVKETQELLQLLQTRFNISGK